MRVCCLAIQCCDTTSRPAAASHLSRAIDPREKFHEKDYSGSVCLCIVVG